MVPRGEAKAPLSSAELEQKFKMATDKSRPRKNEMSYCHAQPDFES